MRIAVERETLIMWKKEGAMPLFRQEGIGIQCHPNLCTMPILYNYLYVKSPRLGTPLCLDWIHLPFHTQLRQNNTVFISVGFRCRPPGFRI